MNLERRIFDISIRCFAGIWLLVFLTSCSATVPLPATPTSEATATEYTVTKPQRAPSPTSETCTVQTGVPTGKLNLRAGAGTDQAVVRVLSEGEILTVIKVGTWVEVSDSQGNRGYVNSIYCK